MNGKLLNEAQVFETWSPIIESQTGIKDSAKLGWMSKYAHYHSLNEGFAYPQASVLNTPGMGNVAPASVVAGGAANFYGAGSQGSGDKFPSLLPLAIQVAARTVGFDIVPVIPMNGPSGVLTYLDYVYAGGRDVNAPGIAGQGAPLTSNDNFTDKFLVFKVRRDSVSGAIYSAVTAGGVGTVYVFAASDNVASTAALLVAYVGKSRIDGGLIFRVLGEDATFTSTTGAEAGSFSNIPQNGSIQAVTFADVLTGTGSIYDSVTTAAAPGNVTTVSAASRLGAAAAVTGYAELVRGLEDHIQGFAGAGPNNDQPFNGNSVNALTAYEPMRRGVGETAYYKTMGMQAFTKFVEAETFQVAATVTTEQIQDLNRQYGIDVLSMMENALVNEISQSINKHILYRAFALGWQNHFNVSLVENTNFNLQLDPANAVTTADALGADNSALTVAVPSFATFNPAGTSFENQGTIQRRIQSKILAAANMVAQRGRRGPANFAVTNLQIATALQDSAQFTFYPLANTVNQNNGALYPIGTLAGLTIYVDPNMEYNDTRVCVGRKGADEEPGLKFMPYLMAESIQTIAEGTMAPKIAVKSRYSLVEAGFHPETQYLTFVVNTFTASGTGAWNDGTAPINIA